MLREGKPCWDGSDSDFVFLLLAGEEHEAGRGKGANQGKAVSERRKCVLMACGCLCLPNDGIAGAGLFLTACLFHVFKIFMPRNLITSKFHANEVKASASLCLPLVHGAIGELFLSSQLLFLHGKPNP